MLLCDCNYSLVPCTGELFVHFSAATLPEEVQFRTAAGELVQTLTMYFEASSYGLGLNDSQSLSPPLRVHAMPSPLRDLLTNEHITTTWVDLPQSMGGPFITSSSSSVRVSTLNPSCQCHHFLRGVHYLLGVTNGPSYGHVLANTLSNLFASLYLKRIDPKV